MFNTKLYTHVQYKAIPMCSIQSYTHVFNKKVNTKPILQQLVPCIKTYTLTVHSMRESECTNSCQITYTKIL